MPDDAVRTSTTSSPGDPQATHQDKNKGRDTAPTRSDTRGVASIRTTTHGDEERSSKDQSVSGQQARHSLQERESNDFPGHDRGAGRPSNRREGEGNSLRYDDEEQERTSEDNNNNNNNDSSTQGDNNKDPGLFSRVWTKLFGKREPESDLTVEMIEELHMMTGCKSGMHA